MNKAKSHTNWARILRTLGTYGFAITGTLAVAALLLILAGVFHAKVPAGQTPSGRPVPADAVLAEAITIERPRFESAVGSIEAVHQTSLAAKILAKVVQVNVTAGQQVKAGEELVRLNDDDLQSRLKQSEAAHSSAIARAEQARADFDRAQRLIQGNAISQAEFEAASTAVRTSEAEVERTSRAIEEAKVFIDYATIKAPYDGTVIDKQVQAGDTVSPGQTLLTLYDPTQMQLVANVRESLAMQLEIGQELPAKLESLDHECLATVREVVPQADAGSRSFQVKVSGPCPPGIYSGMFGRIMLPLENEQLIVIPAQAVRTVGQLTLVDVVEGQQMIRRNIQVGRRLDDDVEVLSGLQPGETVVVSAVKEGNH